ncbi:MAG: hypothetical protein K5929_05650 [Lachnospiraceae bacterium]|nr:hypothetical protein [Lachnospiraceae bacterium]
MKKKVMALMTAMVLAVTMLAGCGSAKKNYESDLEVLTQAADAIDETDMDAGESFSDKLKGLSCKTEEGKVLLADFVSMGAIYDEMSAELAKDEYDAEALNAIMDKTTKLQTDFDAHFNAFKEAATAAGVDTSNFEEEAKAAEDAAEEE